jgi:plasmid maintenance system killer protein
METNFNQKFIDHCETNAKDFTEIKEVLNKIKDNHLEHLKTSINGVENDMIEIKTNQAWQLKFFWLITSVTVTTLIASILALVIKS